jgi:CheY-like chemotaxis protein
VVPLVLIVDDDRILLLRLRKHLEGYGDDFQPVFAKNGREALDVLATQPIDLVVTDIHMPEMNGIALIAHMAEHYPDIPAILITAQDVDTYQRQGLELGVAGFLSKPIIVEDLAELIMSTIGDQQAGGVFQKFSLETFVQLVAMEKISCTLRITEKPSERHGVLFFSEGKRVDARFGQIRGDAAARTILSWETVRIAVEQG